MFANRDNRALVIFPNETRARDRASHGISAGSGFAREIKKIAAKDFHCEMRAETAGKLHRARLPRFYADFYNSRTLRSRCVSDVIYTRHVMIALEVQHTAYCVLLAHVSFAWNTPGEKTFLANLRGFGKEEDFWRKLRKLSACYFLPLRCARHAVACHVATDFLSGAIVGQVLNRMCIRNGKIGICNLNNVRQYFSPEWITKWNHVPPRSDVL